MHSSLVISYSKSFGRLPFPSCWRRWPAKGFSKWELISLSWKSHTGNVCFQETAACGSWTLPRTDLCKIHNVNCIITLNWLLPHATNSKQTSCNLQETWKKPNKNGRGLNLHCHTTSMLLMEESRLFGYHIPMIIKSKCFERRAYPVHDCWPYHRWIDSVCVNIHSDKGVCTRPWANANFIFLKIHRGQLSSCYDIRATSQNVM